MPGLAGSPIILTNKNLNIIGMHQAKSQFKRCGMGIYFKNVLEDLEKQYLKFIEK